MSLFKKTVLSISLAWIVFLFLCGGMTFWSIYNSKSKPSLGGDLSKEIHESMLKNIWCKDFFVNLNGGYSRLLGQRMCNGVLKLNNGQMLSVAGPVKNFDVLMISTEKLTAFCNHLNIPTLFVMFPYKIDSQKAIIPIGAPTDYSIENANLFLSKLKKTPYLNLRPYIASNEVDVTMNFFRTDHHWNFQGAMKAFPYIVDRMLSLKNSTSHGITHTNINAWQECNLGRKFLGTDGRRTGVLYNGFDENVVYYVPRFDTDIFIEIPHKGIWRVGPFIKSNIFVENLKKPKSYFFDRGYSIYGKDYPLVRYKNANAPINQKILIVKDSYAIPIYSFCSTIFTEVNLIDLRWFNDMSLTEFIQLQRPDVLCVMYNPQALSIVEMFDFGVFDTINKKELKYIESINMPATKSQYNHVVVCDSIRPKMKVSCSIRGLNCVSGDFETISIVLCDSTKKKTVFNNRISAKFNGEQRVIFSVPDTYESYKLLIYAGERGSTADNALQLNSVKIEYIE